MDLRLQSGSRCSGDTQPFVLSGDMLALSIRSGPCGVTLFSTARAADLWQITFLDLSFVILSDVAKLERVLNVAAFFFFPLQVCIENKYSRIKKKILWRGKSALDRKREA